MTILTALNGNNSDLVPICLEMYAKKGDTIADVTYGKGVFWKNVDTSQYNLLKTDLSMGVDFANLPYSERTIDVLVLDPPYMHGGKTIKKSINDCYKNSNSGHSSVVRLYADGILEACRVLKKKGIIFIKCQDEIESGKQNFTHNEIITLLELFGYRIMDLFILVQSTTPAMRVNYQKTARKNHSYMLIAEFRK